MLERFGFNDRVRATFEAHASDGLVPGRVTAEHRGRWVAQTASGEVWCDATGRMLHDARGRADLPAVGDWLLLQPLSGEDRAIVRGILPRSSWLSRKAAGQRTDEQVLAANVDAVFCVAGLDGDLNVRRLERYLSMVWEGGAEPVVVLTKADLADDPLAGLVRVRAVAPGVPVQVTSAVTGDGVEGLRGWLDGDRTVALLGSSGVGKSTLTNALAGAEVQATAATRADGRGRHTTVHRELVPLPAGGLLLDTPGMRELALWDGAGLETSFADIEELAASCRFSDCAHVTEPGCAIRASLDDGTLDAARWASYGKLQREAEALEARQDPRLAANRKRRWKQITKHHRERTRLLGRD